MPDKACENQLQNQTGGSDQFFDSENESGRRFPLLPLLFLRTHSSVHGFPFPFFSSSLILSLSPTLSLSSSSSSSFFITSSLHLPLFPLLYLLSPFFPLLLPLSAISPPLPSLTLIPSSPINFLFLWFLFYILSTHGPKFSLPLRISCKSYSPPSPNKCLLLSFHFLAWILWLSSTSALPPIFSFRYSESAFRVIYS